MNRTIRKSLTGFALLGFVGAVPLKSAAQETD